MRQLLEAIEMSSELVAFSKEHKDKIQAILAEVMSYGPDLHNLCLAVALSAVDVKIAMIKKFEEAGFDRKDAIRLTASSLDALKNIDKKGGK